MDRERQRRLAVQLAGLALVAQIWVGFTFEKNLRDYLPESKRSLISYAQFSDRVSQLKPTLFKAPWSYVYLALFLLAMLAVLGGMWIAGLQQALDPDPPDDDQP